MSFYRTVAMARSDVKRTLQEQAFLFLMLTFPVALTVLFAAALGGIGRSSAPCSVADLDASDSGWSSQLVSDLESTGLSGADTADGEGGGRGGRRGGVGQGGHRLGLEPA